MKKCLFAAVLLVLAAGAAWGQTPTYTWTDALGDGDWTNDGNWSITPLIAATTSGPGSGSEVIIPALDTATYPLATNNPVLPAPQTVYSVSVTTGVFDLGSNALIVTNGFSVAAAGTIIIATGSTLILNGGTLDEQGTGDLDDVEISGFVTLGADLTVTGTVTINSGNQLNISGFNVGATAFTNNGNLRLTGASGQTVPSGAPGGTISYYGTGGGNWVFGTAYTNLTIEGSTTLTAGGALDVSGDLQLLGGDLTADSVTVDGTSAINADITTTTGDQTYTGAVTLGDDVTFTAGSGQLVWFGDTVNSDVTAQSLTVTTANVRFDDTVGNTMPALISINITAGTSAINTTDITTIGDQTYTGAVTLEEDGTVFLAGTNTVKFNGGVDGDAATRTLTVGTTGGTNATNVVFGGTVGASLVSVYVYGTTAVNTTTVTTTGAQTYIGDVNISGAVTMQATNSPITIEGTSSDIITGTTGSSLILNAGTGTASGVITLGDSSNSAVNTTVPRLMVTAYKVTTASDNPLDIQGIGAFAVSANTTLDLKDTLTVAGVTVNNGTINAAPLVAGTTAITFNGAYRGNNGNLNGNATNTHVIVFNAAGSNIATDLGKFTHNGDILRFSGSGGSHILSQNYIAADWSAQKTLGRVEIMGNHTVTLASDIFQNSENQAVTPTGIERILKLDGTGSVLNTNSHTWVMGADAKPSSITINTISHTFGNGFYGYYGDLVIQDGAALQTSDFYTTQNTGTLGSSAPYHQVILPASGMAQIEASGNVYIQESFVPTGPGTLTNSTLTMTGTGGLYVRSNALANDPFKPQAHIGNFIVDGTVAAGTDLVFRGDLTINAGKTFNGNSQYIHLYPGTATGNTWTQNGTFIPGTGTVEFGERRNYAGSPLPPYFYPLPDARTFVIRGNTTWYNLRFHETGATVRFSEYPDTHRVQNKMSVYPLDASGNRIEVPAAGYNAGSDPRPPFTITLTRITSGHPASPPFSTVPPSTIDSTFWSFHLASGGALDLNNVFILFSYSDRRLSLPSPPLGNWLVDASPYVYIGSGGVVTNTLPTFPVWAAASYYNVNWYGEVTDFYYAFTEDFDRNGRIDRIRLQSSFELLDAYSLGDEYDSPDHSPFYGFEVAVAGYEIDRSKGYNGYARADYVSGTGTGIIYSNLPSKMDSILIFLQEKDENDGDRRLHWKIRSNPYLRNLSTRRVLIGPPNGKYPEGISWDTVPPRINYAFTIPNSGRKEIFFQTSEPLFATPGIHSASHSKVTSGTIAPLAPAEYIINGLSADFTLSDLTVNSPYPSFRLTGIEDKAEAAADLQFDTTKPHSYRFPSPKYPVDYNYSGYDFVVNGVASGSAITGTTTQPRNRANRLAFLPPLADGEWENRVTDLLISVPPQATTDTGYFVWPLWAKFNFNPVTGDLGVTPPGYGYMGPGGSYHDTDIIWDFTGKRYLERKDDITMQARLGAGLSGTPILISVFKLPDYYKARTVHGSPGLWHPVMGGEAFVNMVPKFFATVSPPPFYPLLPVTSSGATPLFNYVFSQNDFPGNGMVEFFFRLSSAPPDLLAGRLDIPPGTPIPPDWYRRVRPFCFEIHDVTRQRGGVTIRNNMINSARREQVWLDYTLEKSGRVTIQVFTLDGNLVKALVRETKGAGEHHITWDGTNMGNRPVARGMYYIRIVAPDIDEIRKVMVVK
jgi:hypothetical protein